VATSEYLKVIGSKLAPDIDIMWTGDKVIPKEITVASLEGITQILKRAPVIWDNEHANDYDQKRIYLGDVTISKKSKFFINFLTPVPAQQK
jgi:protein O-GlcNAcase/histone acetyltransferase